MSEYVCFMFFAIVVRTTTNRKNNYKHIETVFFLNAGAFRDSSNIWIDLATLRMASW